jgi:hypothetical protein
MGLTKVGVFRPPAYLAMTTNILQRVCASAPTGNWPGRIFGTVDDRLTNAEDVSHVVEALANGLRSAAEVTKQTRLPGYNVRAALRSMVVERLVTASPDSDGTLVFRLSDNGQDVLKGLNAAARKPVIR